MWLRVLAWASVCALIVPLVGNSQPAHEACEGELREIERVTLDTPLGPAQGKLCFDDGDSFSIGPTWIRIFGIDAPEMSPSCIRLSPGAPENCRIGLAALDELLDLLIEGAKCEATRKDKHNRWLATCRTTKGIDIGSELVRQGRACAATKYDRSYIEQQGEAKAAKRGIWAPNASYVPSAMCQAR